MVLSVLNLACCCERKDDHRLHAAIRFQRNELMLDPTEILKFRVLKALKKESIIKTIYFAVLGCACIIWCVKTS